MKILPNETEIIGKWIKRGADIVGDINCERIEILIKENLKKLGSDESGWSILYQDPNDSRYWEMTFPESQMHGGGPPALT